MTFSLTRAIFGALEHRGPSTADDVAAALQWTVPGVRRKLRELARAGYVTEHEGVYALSHELD